MNIIELARLELKREGKLNAWNEGSLLLDRMATIMKHYNYTNNKNQKRRSK